MDPAVAAALIATPTAALAAVAAYAAGRAQGRAAVDAVRRQHQREAYAALNIAARRYWRDTAERATKPRVHRDLHLAGEDLPSVADVNEAVVMVALEGPDHLGTLAECVAMSAEALATMLRVDADGFANSSEEMVVERERGGHFYMPVQIEGGERLEVKIDPASAHEDLRQATEDFGRAARRHLNEGTSAAQDARLLKEAQQKVPAMIGPLF
jgi:hypothetical protein